MAECAWLKSVRNIKKKIQIRRARKCIKNIKLLYKSWEAVIKLFNDYSLIMPGAKYKTKYGEGLKIITPKQMHSKITNSCRQKLLESC